MSVVVVHVLPQKGRKREGGREGGKEEMSGGEKRQREGPKENCKRELLRENLAGPLLLLFCCH